jgi:hypothetical protein
VTLVAVPLKWLFPAAKLTTGEKKEFAFLPRKGKEMFTTHLGLNYLDEEEEVKCFQMLGQDGKSYANANFHGNRCTKFDYAKSFEKEARAWFKTLKEGLK